jgi:hypothetical protein
VPYAFVQDLAASWEQYEQIATALGGSPPPGLIMHLAGPTDEGFRIIAVWQSDQAWQQFEAERLTPLIASLRGSIRPQPTFRELRPQHIVIGTGINEHDELGANKQKEEHK